MISYEELAERLALDLAFLRIGDFITLRASGSLVQVIQNTDSLTAELSANRSITDDEWQLLAGAGWQEPHRGRPMWLRHTPWPLTANSARELASGMIDVARAFVSPGVTQITYDARNYDIWEPIHPPSLDGLRRMPGPGSTPPTPD